jgi:2-polyprenyl-3-methyl-5-hydroxy-6-metoxy-1,4-benzoquinol methylase
MRSDGPNADHRFVDYYARNSASDRTRQRFESVQRIAMDMRASLGESTQGLDLVDIGCGAGTQTMLWAEAGHRARGIDISAPLIEIARKRAQETGVVAEFQVGSANAIDLPDSSADVVLISELLEHLVTWESCIDEATRILRPGGVIYMSTTNRLCPVQQEFSLPAYSWYPSRLKKYCEKLSTTTHPHWVQHATFPAVHWFTYYQLRDYLDARGVTASDRFDIMRTSASRLKTAAVAAIRASRAVRFAAHVLTPYTVAVGHRRYTTIAK